MAIFLVKMPRKAILRIIKMMKMVKTKLIIVILKKKLLVYHGADKTTEILLKTSSNAKHVWNVYAGSKGPSISMGINSLRKGYFALYRRGIKSNTLPK